jgi:hypothetical protein
VIHPAQQLVIVDDLRVLDILPPYGTPRVKQPDDFLVAPGQGLRLPAGMAAEFVDGQLQPRACRPAGMILAVHRS